MLPFMSPPRQAAARLCLCPSCVQSGGTFSLLQPIDPRSVRTNQPVALVISDVGVLKMSQRRSFVAL